MNYIIPIKFEDCTAINAAFEKARAALSALLALCGLAGTVGDTADAALLERVAGEMSVIEVDGRPPT